MTALQGLIEHVPKCAANKISGSHNINKLGDIFILPDTYIGGVRHLNKIYQDALAIKRVTGHPDLFITMTCNPNWPELKRVLERFPKGTSCQDIPTFTSRLFHTKLMSLINDITKKKYLEK